jgi:hypothetical protein
MAGRYGNLDYPRLTKTSFAFGVALFGLGALGHVAGPALFGPLPAWESVLFTDMEMIGVAIALVSPFLFGILLPLTE